MEATLHTETASQPTLPDTNPIVGQVRGHVQDPQYLGDASRVYRMFSMDVGTAEFPRVVGKTADAAKSMRGVMTSSQVEEVLKDPSLAPYITKVRLLKSDKPNGLVLVWLRQAHAERGIAAEDVVDDIRSEAVKNQEAIAAIGEALAVTVQSPCMISCHAARSRSIHEVALSKTTSVIPRNVAESRRIRHVTV